MALSEDEELEMLRLQKEKSRLPVYRDQLEASLVNPAQGMTGFEQFKTGTGQGLNAIGQGVSQVLGRTSQEDIASMQRRDQPLLQTNPGAAGSVLGEALPFLPFSFVPGANTLPGAGVLGAAMGASQPIGSGDTTYEKLKKTILYGGLGAGTQAAIPAIGSYFSGKASDALLREANDAVKNATLSKAQDAGYVVPPTQANPNIINRTLEGLSGKIQTGQAASIKNQDVTDGLARQSLGMSPTDPITKSALQSLRAKAGDAYEVIKSFGPLPIDQSFTDQVNKLGGSYQALKREFPNQANTDIDNLINDLSKTPTIGGKTVTDPRLITALQKINPPEVSAEGAVELSKKLRYDGSANMNSPDPAKKTLGRVQLQAANTLEDLIDRTLQKTGQSDLMQNFRQARVQIAKSYSVQNALDESTGHVVGRKLASQLAADKPLSGGLETAAGFSQAFPKATQEVLSSMPGVSPLDFGAASIATASSGNPAYLSGIGLRPTVRSMILSKPYQALMTTKNYDPGILARTVPGILSDQSIQAVLRTLIPSSIYSQQ